MKFILTLAAVFSTIVLMGCSMEPSYTSDQCLRAELFKQCMTLLPKGPESVHNSNDWSKVVYSCESVAYRQSIRKYQSIKEGCK